MLNIIEKIGVRGAKCKCTRCNNEYITKDKYSSIKSPVGNLCFNCKNKLITEVPITREYLKEIYKYNPLTGELTHRHTTCTGAKDKVATSSHIEGYLRVLLHKKQYLAHRIIYMYMTGEFPNQIDHINHKRNDNRWCNLRNVINKENHQNESLSKNSVTKVTGVCLHKPTNKYRAYIMVNRKQVHLGLFDSIQDAMIARKQANKQYGFHPNHGT